MAFRMIDSKLWNDPRVRASSVGAQGVLLNLLTGPKRSCLPGLLPLGRAGLAEAMGLPAADADALLTELEGRGLVEVDDAAPLICVPDGPEWDGPVSKKLLAAWVSLLSDLPPSHVTSRHVTRLRAAALKRCSAADVEATLGAFAKSLAAVDTLSPGYSADENRPRQKSASSASASAPASATATASATAAASAANVRRNAVTVTGSRDPVAPPEHEEQSGGEGTEVQRARAEKIRAGLLLEVEELSAAERADLGKDPGRLEAYLDALDAQRRRLGQRTAGAA